mmetsp:Transcript_3488/g.14066  ORF Transcript_3488/g.14066 Transcript_3488/m.14066 type:complete len:305 (-) Transcript_3488:259-1173(-)
MAGRGGAGGEARETQTQRVGARRDGTRTESVLGRFLLRERHRGFRDPRARLIQPPLEPTRRSHAEVRGLAVHRRARPVRRRRRKERARGVGVQPRRARSAFRRHCRAPSASADALEHAESGFAHLRGRGGGDAVARGARTRFAAARVLFRASRLGRLFVRAPRRRVDHRRRLVGVYSRRILAGETRPHALRAGVPRGNQPRVVRPILELEPGEEAAAGVRVPRRARRDESTGFAYVARRAAVGFRVFDFRRLRVPRASRGARRAALRGAVPAVRVLGAVLEVPADEGGVPGDHAAVVRGVDANE